MTAPIAVHLARTTEKGALELPIADRAALGVALGMALGGQPVVAVLDGAGRLGAVAEILATAGGIALAGGFDVPLVVRVPYGPEAGNLDGAAGRFVANLDGVSVVAGSSAGRSSGLVRAASAARRPVVVLELRGNPLSPTVEVALDRAVIEREGDHVVLASWAGGVAVALEAAEQLASEGISATVVDLVTLVPLDRATLRAEVERCGRLVVVDPAGDPLADAVVQAGLAEAFWALEAPIRKVPGNLDAVLAASREITGE